jgi:hypothetical protein
MSIGYDLKSRTWDMPVIEFGTPGVQIFARKSLRADCRDGEPYGYPERRGSPQY